MKKTAIVVSAAAMILLPATSAWAAPDPSPVAPTHTGTACASVFSNNPNVLPGAPISDQGGSHFGAVGAAFCGLPVS
jgi:hypothetical protein